MGNYFDLFPRIAFDISQTGRKRKDLITDVFFRFKFLDYVKKKKVAYFPYKIQEGDTPDIVADKVYGDSEAHWMILLLNEIVDVETEWFMSTRTFNNYIRSKYGSLATAQQQVHHYERIITTKVLGYYGEDREVSVSSTSTIDAADIQSGDTFTARYADIPYDNYTDLAATTFEYATLPNGYQVEVKTTKNVVYCYDYESDQNDRRQYIKMLYPESYPDVKKEFQTMTASYNPGRRIHFRSVKI
jgi:hypothetical protein